MLLRDKPELSEVELRDLLHRHWGATIAGGRITPLTEIDGNVATSVSELSVIEIDPQRQLLLKRIFDPEAVRPIGFHELKCKVMQGCADDGIPVALPLPTKDNQPVVIERNMSFEVMGFLSGCFHFDGRPRQVESMLDGLLCLYRSFERQKDDAAGLTAWKTPVIVETSERTEAAKQLVEDILPEAQKHSKGFAIIAAAACLQEDFAWELAMQPPPPQTQRKRASHGDLHGANLLFDPNGRLAGILDFDNIELCCGTKDCVWALDHVALGTGSAKAVRKATKRLLASGLWTSDEILEAVPRFISHAIPVILDIAKDILVRDDDRPCWPCYLHLLNIQRKLFVHRCICEAILRS